MIVFVEYLFKQLKLLIVKFNDVAGYQGPVSMGRVVRVDVVTQLFVV